MPAVNGVAFYANFMQTRFNRSAEPTVEGDSVTDSLGDTVSAGGQVPDLTDTQRHTRITATDNGVGDTYRFDMALDQAITADFAILDNHTLRTTFNEAVGNNINIHHDSDAVFAGATKISPSQVYSGLVGKDRPYLDFDGVNDTVTVADNAALEFNNGDGSIEAWVNFPDATENIYIYNRREDGSNIIRMLIDNSGATTLNCTAFIGATNMQVASTSWSPESNRWYHLVWTFVNGGANAIYIDGTSQTLSIDIQTGGTIEMTASLTPALTQSTYNQMRLMVLRQWNRALSGSDVTNLNNGNLVPAADQWGSQTTLVANGTAWTGATGATPPDSWSVVTAGTFTIVDRSGDSGAPPGAAASLRIAVNSTPTANPSITQAMTVVANKAHRFSIWARRDTADGYKLRIGTSSGGAEIYDSGTLINTVWTYTTTEFTPTGTTIYVTLIVTDGDAAEKCYFDDASVIQIGCVAEYSPDGINPDEGVWYDTSDNNLDGTITGATAKDTPDVTDGDLTIIEFAEAEDRYWFFELNPDALTADGNTQYGQIAVGKKFAPITAPTLTVPERQDYGGVRLATTRGGRRSANRRHGRRRSWELTWDYISEREKTDFEALLEETGGGEYPMWFTLNSGDRRPVFYYGRIVNSPTFTPAASQVYRVTLVVEEEL